MKEMNIYNKEGFRYWNESIETPIESAVSKMVEANYERSNMSYADMLNGESDMENEIKEIESKQAVLEKAFGRYLEVQVRKGAISASEIGYVLGFLKPNETFFIKSRRSGPIEKVDPTAKEVNQ